MALGPVKIGKIGIVDGVASRPKPRSSATASLFFIHVHNKVQHGDGEPFFGHQGHDHQPVPRSNNFTRR